MPYSQFTLSKAVEDFQITIIEGDRFLPEISPVNPSSLLKDTLKETLPWAIAYHIMQYSSDKPKTIVETAIYRVSKTGDRIATGWSNYIMLYRI